MDKGCVDVEQGRAKRVQGTAQRAPREFFDGKDTRYADTNSKIQKICVKEPAVYKLRRRSCAMASRTQTKYLQSPPRCLKRG